MARFRNDTGSVLSSQEFGLLPPGEFEAPGWDPEVHGAIPGCTLLDAPAEGGGEEQPAEADGPDLKATRKRGRAADHDKETALCRF